MTLASQTDILTVLVVDDDPPILRLTCRLLVDQGYRTIQAISATSAFQQLDDTHELPDVLVVDYSLDHGMNGVELALALRKRLQCELPAIIVSGYHGAPAKRASESDCLFLAKPYSALALCTLIAGIQARGGVATTQP